MQAIFHWHSFVEILSWDLRILVDPFVDGNKHCDVSVEQILAQPVSAVIVTHWHDDHIWCTAEISEQYSCPIITSYELGQYFTQHLWLDNVSTQGIWWSVEYDGFEVKLFQARHGWWIADMSSGITTVAAGAIITIWDYVIYHAGDTGLFGDMKLLGEYYDIDVAFLPIGDRYTMWVSDAVIAASWIQPKYAVPIHYDTRDIIKADDMEFARLVMLGNHAVPKVLKPGQGVVIE